MSKEGTLITVGVLILIVPFLGLPYSWLAWVLPILGAATLIIAQLLRKERGAPRADYAEAPAPREVPLYDAPSAI